eukprot:TRINITY_DN433_c0_g2_i1.p1 TRINITY_DN433_c0_g2~~TRINITY_DN433_c0_g2_i1.p1  ORF type:complete len:282 (+),score=42.14 TRINITY_DN433_c0_g2_i1:367-1212(+)
MAVLVHIDEHHQLTCVAGESATEICERYTFLYVYDTQDPRCEPVYATFEAGHEYRAVSFCVAAVLKYWRPKHCVQAELGERTGVNTTVSARARACVVSEWQGVLSDITAFSIDPLLASRVIRAEACPGTVVACEADLTPYINAVLGAASAIFKGTNNQFLFTQRTHATADFIGTLRGRHLFVEVKTPWSISSTPSFHVQCQQSARNAMKRAEQLNGYMNLYNSQFAVLTTYEDWWLVRREKRHGQMHHDHLFFSPTIPLASATPTVLHSLYFLITKQLLSS